MNFQRINGKIANSVQLMLNFIIYFVLEEIGTCMARITRSALLMYSAEQMFHLVNDVVAYPDFLPGCTGTRILDEQQLQMIAAVDVSKGGISKTFTTRNTLIIGEQVKMDLVDGPFKMLTGGWTFKALDHNACKVSLDLEFVFSSKLVEVAFGRIFADLVNNMVHSFTLRAKEVYGVE